MSDKVCPLCRVRKPLTEYHRRASSPDGRQTRCKVCHCDQMREHQRANAEANQRRVAQYNVDYPDKARGRHLSQRYGIGVEQYDAMLAQQGGVCGACGEVDPRKRRLSVDRHGGRICGLLCSYCLAVRSMGGLDGERLRQVAAYYRARQPLIRAGSLTYVPSPLPLSDEARMWGYHLRTSYGLSLDDYTTVFDRQGGRCAACRETDDKRRLSVDCRDDGWLRGLLCWSCTSIASLCGFNERLCQIADYTTRTAKPHH